MLTRLLPPHLLPPVSRTGYDRESILQMAALAAKWKEPPRDALDTLTLTSADLTKLDGYEQVGQPSGFKTETNSTCDTYGAVARARCVVLSAHH